MTATEATKQIPGGRLWRRKTNKVPGWETDDFAIMEHSAGFVVFVSTIHDRVPGDDCEFYRRRFDTVEQAMEHAERI